MPRIAFYTQTFNSSKYIRKAIESVLNQTFTDFVYYITDDVSTDNTCDIVREYAQKDKRIIFTVAEENFMMQTTNISLKMIYESDCEFLCTLDADDWYDSDFAEKMIKR